MKDILLHPWYCALCITFLYGFSCLWSCSYASQHSPSKVEIALDGRLFVDDVPTFFLGFAPGPPVDLKTPEGGDGWAELAEGGISVVRHGAPPRTDWNEEAEDLFEAYLDVAYGHGVRVWPMLRELVLLSDQQSRDRLSSFINRFKDHPGVLFWKTTDEPQWCNVPPEPIIEAYQIMRALDPNHPVWICHAPRGTLEQLKPYNDACDVLSTDIYPVSEPSGKHSLEPNKSLSMVGDYTRRMVELSEGKKMVFMVLQVCWSGVMSRPDKQNRLMFPTMRQERYMMYQAIICGARSLSFFGMPFGLTGRDAELGWNWTYWRAVLKPLFAEIKPGSELYPVLTAPDSDYPLAFTGAPQIEVTHREAGVYLYIIAAAREGRRRRVRFSGVEDGEVTVLFENRTILASNGGFSDYFSEHDVHVYRATKREH